MRITVRGQLTIPKAVRDRAGLSSGTEVEVLFTDGAVQIHKTGRRKPDAIDKRIAAFTGTGSRRHTTEELMALLRSDG